MCIICHKESGIKLPEMNILEACFKSNRHGAGILLWRHNSPTAEIHKGYMSFSDFKDAFEHLDIKNEDNVVFHFRISTAGGINQENCHPFPISQKVEDLKQLNIENVSRALVHNGIIGAGDKTLSDTQLFIKYVLAQSSDIYEHLNDPIIQKCIEDFVPGNRYIIMDTIKRICVRLGTGWYTDSETGLHFSNKSYMSQLVDYTTISPKTYTPKTYYSQPQTAKTPVQVKMDFSQPKKSTTNTGNKKYFEDDYAYYPKNNNDQFNFEDDESFFDDEFGQYVMTSNCPVCKKICDFTEVYNDTIYICNECKSLINIDNYKIFNMTTKTWELAK